MSDIVLRLLFILVLVLLNGYFSLAETAMIAGRRSRFQQLAEAGDPRAKTALELIDNHSLMLSTAHAGSMLVSILVGTFGGESLAHLLSASLVRAGLPAWIASVLGFVCVVLSITYVSIVIGELVPKELALRRGERIALRLARSISVLASMLAPIVRILSRSSALVLKLFGASRPVDEPVTPEEMRLIIDEGTSRGTFQPAERGLVHSVFSLSEWHVTDLMISRAAIVWLDPDAPLEETRRRILESGHQGFPVCKGVLDAVVGVVSARGILEYWSSGEGLERFARPPLYVPQHAQVLRVLESLTGTGVDVALAVDEYGVVQGLVTMDHIVEAVLRGIPTRTESVEPLAVQRPDGSWLMDGLLRMEEFRGIFPRSVPPARGAYQTLSGFIMAHLGRIPSAGDAFSLEGVQLEVTRMEGNRVGKVVARKHGGEESPAV